MLVFDFEKFTPAEVEYLDYRFGAGPGSFKLALFHAIEKADLVNRMKLAAGFPEHVAAVAAWAHGDLAERYYAHVNAKAAA